ncbi:hypothetical protein SAMN04488540_12060 [Ferrimonas sediminum]|uniref:Heavy metal binding domain-containing protein n=1 Tax=Ferrimonas sediminum TaxID=718193 RepID=A0A1G8ZN10_9GAMM|nr:heavy metal-binding domain-containing protein [Ferrimonas sediminum]SDK16486.1 hypothetical protein SAMN04488540_12060 [Ferrimonas sediminum]
MKNLFTALAMMATLLLSPLTLAHSDGHGHGTMAMSNAAEAVYACPMHSKVQGVKGDECPKCGMKLQAMSAQSGHHSGCDKANCPKHQAMQKHHKGCDKANCPKHKGMQQHHKGCDKANCPKHKAMTSQSGHYTHACPMNPKIVGMAGDSCPACGMDLEPVAEADRKAYTHACPMNPAIRGFEGDSCPKCGMDLEPMAAAAQGHSHH